MRSNRTLEIGTGLFVLLGFAALLFLTTQLPSSGLKLSSSKAGFRVSAEFDNVGDLKTGAPVTMAGVDIGDVQSIQINPQDYRAVVTMRIDPQYTQIPDDSDASISTQGLLGGKYIAVGAGGSEMFLKNGSRIQFTQSAIVLENLINKLFANYAGGGSNANSQGGGNSDGGAGAGSGGSGGASASASQSGSQGKSGTSNADGKQGGTAPPPRKGKPQESTR